MLKLKIYSKLISIILIVTVLFTACDVPDISKFTETSAEMTRGIREGVKNTGNLINTASERADLYSEKTRKGLKQSFKEYQKAVKPTMDALDGLDGYLEALNALSQANKKSGENATAVVNSVSSLVTAVSGFAFATEAINVASGLLTLAEQFRTAKSFQKRVNLASEIIEGKYIEKTENYTVGNEIKQRTVLVKTCGSDANEQIVSISRRAKEFIDKILVPLTDAQKNQLNSLTPTQQSQKLREWKQVNDDELKILQSLSAKGKRDKLKEWGRLSDEGHTFLEASEITVSAFGCGVLDFLKFNMADLKGINNLVSTTMIADVRVKNRVVLGYYESILATNRRIENESQAILNYKNLAALIREYEETGGSLSSINDSKIKLKEHLDNLFIWDSQLKTDVLQKIATCGAACGNMVQLLNLDLNTASESQVLNIINGIPKDKFDRSVGDIEVVLDARKITLDQQNGKYLDDVKRIQPAHTLVINEIETIEKKKNQLNSLLDTSVEALDAWRETHANLKVAVNTKKPLTVAKLIGKVREIWNIVSPKAN